MNSISICIQSGGERLRRQMKRAQQYKWKAVSPSQARSDDSCYITVWKDIVVGWSCGTHGQKVTWLATWHGETY